MFIKTFKKTWKANINYYNINLLVPNWHKDDKQILHITVLKNLNNLAIKPASNAAAYFAE